MHAMVLGHYVAIKQLIQQICVVLYVVQSNVTVKTAVGLHTVTDRCLA